MCVFAHAHSQARRDRSGSAIRSPFSGRLKGDRSNLTKRQANRSLVSNTRIACRMACLPPSLRSFPQATPSTLPFPARLRQGFSSTANSVSPAVSVPVRVPFQATEPFEPAEIPCLCRAELSQHGTDITTPDKAPVSALNFANHLCRQMPPAWFRHSVISLSAMQDWPQGDFRNSRAQEMGSYETLLNFPSSRSSTVFQAAGCSGLRTSSGL